MAGRQIFNPDGFCNVTEDGKTVGFSFAFKAQYYRGFTLSILRDIAVTVDDENFNREDIRLTVNGETFTLEECRTVIDPERFEQTVTAYNGYCETGDTEFFKDKRFLLPIWKAPFYAARIRPSGYGTVGGIRINENCEACGPDFYPGGSFG